MPRLQPTTAAESADVAAIMEVFRNACTATEAGDREGLMAMFHEIPGVFLYDYLPPRITDVAELRVAFDRATTGLVGPMTCEIVEADTYLLGDDAAFTASIMHVAARYESGDDVELTYRATDVWKKIDGRWAVVHEHASVPVDPITARADLTSAPA